MSSINKIKVIGGDTYGFDGDDERSGFKVQQIIFDNTEFTSDASLSKGTLLNQDGLKIIDNEKEINIGLMKVSDTDTDLDGVIFASGNLQTWGSIQVGGDSVKVGGQNHFNIGIGNEIDLSQSNRVLAIGSGLSSTKSSSVGQLLIGNGYSANSNDLFVAISGASKFIINTATGITTTLNLNAKSATFNGDLTATGKMMLSGFKVTDNDIQIGKKIISTGDLEVNGALSLNGLAITDKISTSKGVVLTLAKDDSTTEPFVVNKIGEDEEGEEISSVLFKVSKDGAIASASNISANSISLTGNLTLPTTGENVGKITAKEISVDKAEIGEVSHLAVRQREVNGQVHEISLFNPLRRQYALYYSSGTTESGIFLDGSFITASGNNSVIIKPKSIIMGEGLIAASITDPQIVLGKYNVQNDTAAIIIGNGNTTTPSTAFKVAYNGDIQGQGNLDIGGAISANGNIEAKGYIKDANITSEDGKIIIKNGVSLFCGTAAVATQEWANNKFLTTLPHLYQHNILVQKYYAQYNDLNPYPANNEYKVDGAYYIFFTVYSSRKEPYSSYTGIPDGLYLGNGLIKDGETLYNIGFIEKETGSAYVCYATTVQGKSYSKLLFTESFRDWSEDTYRSKLVTTDTVQQIF